MPTMDATKMPTDGGRGWGGCLGKLLMRLHHLYRPHHDHHTYIPARYALGTVAEVAYSEDYELTCEIWAKEREPHVTHISLPVPVFKPTMYFRGKLVGYNKVAAAGAEEGRARCSGAAGAGGASRRR